MWFAAVKTYNYFDFPRWSLVSTVTLISFRFLSPFSEHWRTETTNYLAQTHTQLYCDEAFLRRCENLSFACVFIDKENQSCFVKSLILDVERERHVTFVMIIVFDHFIRSTAKSPQANTITTITKKNNAKWYGRDVYTSSWYTRL